MKPDLLEYACAVPAAVLRGFRACSSWRAAPVLSSPLLSCPAWRAALGRRCREGLGSCLHSRFSLSLPSTCLFPDDTVRGRHSDKLRASLLACSNLTQERAPSSSPSPSPPLLHVSPTPLSEHTQHTTFLGQAKCFASALNRKEPLKLACKFGPQPRGNLWATGQGYRAGIPGVPILPS